jgi:hypothetical protein
MIDGYGDHWGWMMSSDVSGRTILAIVPEGALGPSRCALLLALIDRARHNREFGQQLRFDPVAAAERMGVTLSDSEWSGLRDLLTS